MDPKPYYDYYISLLTVGLGVPKTVLFEESKGAGAEWALKNYYSDVAAIQKTDVEPMLIELYKRLQDNNIISGGEIELEWNPLFELDEREFSFVKSRLALGHRMQSEAVLVYLNSGFGVELTEEGWIKRIFVPSPEDKQSEYVMLPPTSMPTTLPLTQPPPVGPPLPTPANQPEQSSTALGMPGYKPGVPLPAGSSATTGPGKPPSFGVATKTLAENVEELLNLEREYGRTNRRTGRESEEENTEKA